MSSTKQPLTVVHKLAQWQNSYKDTGVYIGFDDDLVVFYEIAPKENNAAYMYPAEALTEPWRSLIASSPEGAWLIPHIERFGEGEDIRDAVLADYAARHDGAAPTVEQWDWRR